MRFRQHQSDAQAASRRLLRWFGLLVAALVVAVNLALAGIYRLLLPLLPLPAFFWATNTGVVLMLVIGGAWLETQRLRAGGGERVARWAGGRLLTDPRELAERRLLNVVDEMALASGQPRPAVYLLEREPGINAFVAGWTAETAALAVTRGALERLTRDELQGLVAHELGHIREGDLPLNMRLLALVWGLSLVHGLGVELTQPDEHGRHPPLAPFGLVLRALGWLGWLAGRLLQAAVSRQREYLADACAVQFTRSRDGLGNTLRKIWFLQRGPEGRLRSPHAEALAAMLLDDGARRRWLA
ncbi:MAG: M48 family metalloprotease, partial [Aquabacterium sp.]|nr:M48 family metalloprotease [Aquabacterium sp.]